MFLILVLTFIFATLLFLLVSTQPHQRSHQKARQGNADVIVEESKDEGDQSEKKSKKNKDPLDEKKKKIRIIYCSQTDRSKKMSFSLKDKLSSHNLSVIGVDCISKYDPEDLFTETSLCVFIISTYTDGGPCDTGKWFFQWLSEAVVDFRIQKDALSHLHFAVFGNGNTLYGANYNRAPKELFGWLKKLSGRHVFPLGEGDEVDNPEESFEDWADSLIGLLINNENSTVDHIPEQILYESDDENQEIEGNGDLEDLIQSSKKSNDEVNKENLKQGVRTTKEMVTPSLRSALTKQGYKIVGSHSGVKLCRWTKSMLRGRGGCYKHSFYGIASHRCMETTPSLACANKCVFCWRHHTNPVGTEWRWKVDPPQTVLEGALESHRKMIREMKGVPGVDPLRLEEGLNPRHCALSLVGEPIMYPHINEFVDMLHAKGISSFLVTNAQFPDLISAMKPVTQLYVSVDAATKDSLKTIDRPLFGDFWERFLGSLDALSKKKQRTVYRLTLVKEYNVETVKEYAQLIIRGTPDFVEIKGVTYCGYSGANPLTMNNVPFHTEVINFAHNLLTHENLNDKYALACEHEHSCSILIANKSKFLSEGGKWHTWIDYDKFQELIKSGADFGSEDYMAETPAWAVFGSSEHGFDPIEQRYYRKKGTKDTPIDHGC